MSKSVRASPRRLGVDAALYASCVRDASRLSAQRGIATPTTTMAQQTTLDDWAKDPVDPEIRAHVYSLITAVSTFAMVEFCC
jgi:hypothetical protein